MNMELLCTFDVYPKLYRDNKNSGINYDYVKVDDQVVSFPSFMHVLFTKQMNQPLPSVKLDYC